MAYYYSASERAFFSSEFMTVGEMPSDKIAVADEVWKKLVADQSAGKIIRSASNGNPESANQTLPALTGYLLPDDVSISGGLEVSSGTTLKGNLSVSGKINAKSVSATDITTTGNATVGRTLTVNGETKLKGATEVSGTSSFTGAATFYNRIDTSGTIYTASDAAMRRKGSDGFLQLGMENVLHGGRLNLYGKDYTSANKGGFELLTGDGTLSKGLNGYPSGKLSWDGKNISRTVNGVSADDSGDIKLTSLPKNSYTKQCHVISDARVSKGTKPSYNVFSQLYFTDSTGETGANGSTNGLAAIESAVRSHGGSDINVFADKNVAGTDERAQLVVGWKPNQQGVLETFTIAPTPRSDSNDSSIATTAWCKNTMLEKTGGVVNGTIVSDTNTKSFVDAANGQTAIGSTAKGGLFSPLWAFESTDGGSFVLSGFKNTFQISYVSKENRATNTNTQEWASFFDTNGTLYLGGYLSSKGKIVLESTFSNAKGNSTVCLLEEAPVLGALDCVYAGANNATYLCSGEVGYNTASAKAFRQTLNRSAEDVVVASDQSVVLAANCQNQKEVETRKVEIDTVGNIRFPARLYPSLENGVWSDSPYVLRHGRIDRTSLPEKDEALYIPFYGAGGTDNATHRLARILYVKRTSGNAELSLGVNNPNNATAEEFCGLTARWRQDSASGEVYLSHHPGVNSDDYTVATTGWVNKTVNAKAGIMTKKGSRSSAGTLTVSGLKANQLIIVTCNMRNDTWDGGDYALVEADNVVNGWFKTGSGTGFYTTFMIATASTVNFKLTHQGISSNTMTVYAMG